MNLKMMIIVVTLSCLPLSIFAKGSVKLYGEKIPSETHFGLQISGSLNEPREMLAGSYSADDNGFALGISIISTPKGQSNLSLKTVSFLFSRDSYDLLENKTKQYSLSSPPAATISAIQVRSHEDVPIIWKSSFGLSLFQGEIIGGSRFKLNEQAFNKMGKATLTELKNENDMNQVFSGNVYGLHLTGLDHVSLELSYDQMSVERAWMVWHQVVSTIAYGIAKGAVPEISSWMLPDNLTNSKLFHIFSLLCKSGVTYYLYDWDYDNHSWPFTGDDPPLHYTRTTLTLNIYF